MNPRISELMTVVGLQPAKNLEYRGSYEKMTRPEQEEFDKIYHFADLIVRECMLCCERVISDPVPKSVDTWLNGGTQCMTEIKYHFGVEE